MLPVPAPLWLVLGVAYKGGIKVDILSPARAIVERLRADKVGLVVCDPMYSDEELDRLFGPGLTTGDVAAAIRAARTVLVIPDHPEFLKPYYLDAVNHPREDTLVVIDNHGLMQDVAWADHVVYRRAGSERWFSVLETGDRD